MTLGSRLQIGQLAITDLGLSGSSGDDFFISNPVSTENKVPGTITSRLALSIIPTSCGLSPYWSVSNNNDGETFRKLVSADSGAVTARYASATLWFEGPKSLSAYPYVVMAVDSAGSSNLTSTTVLASTSFNWEREFVQTGKKVRMVQNAKTGTIAVASGNTVAANPLPLADVVPGCLAANVDISTKTASWTAKCVWQVSDNGSTWESFYPLSDDAHQVVVTGSNNSVANTVSIAVDAPAGLCAHRYGRMTILTGGATASAANETYTISYNFKKRVDD